MGGSRPFGSESMGSDLGWEDGSAEPVFETAAPTLPVLLDGNHSLRFLVREIAVR